MKKLTAITGLALAGMLAAQSNASAQLVTSTTYGGHTFELIAAPNGISWSDAEAAAVADGGYLAVLPDAATTSAVYDALINNGYFTANNGPQFQAWLGGFTTDPGFTTTDPTAWAWVT